MPAPKPSADAMTPYQFPNPKEAQKEIVIGHAIPTDEREWVPQAENVWFRPLCLNVSTGYWMNLLRVRKSGVLSRHRHPQAVHGMVLKGRWRYLGTTGWRPKAAMSSSRPAKHIRSTCRKTSKR